MNQSMYDTYLSLLKNELVPALGCTEPIAIAYAAAKAAEILGRQPQSIEMWCSGNIVKNVKSVIVPNSDGLKGIEAAAILGALGGDPNKKLEVLEGVSSQAVTATKELVDTGFCKCRLAQGVANLYLVAKVSADGHTAEVEIADTHTNITKITKDGKILFEDKISGETGCGDDEKRLLNVKDILKFANAVDLDDIKDILDNQIDMNLAISDEGLASHYGVAVGKTLMDVYGDDIKIRAKARAAAGSDARMSGCPLPVVINGGSGNQGMAVSLPVIEYAKEIGASRELLYRGLVLSNLVAMHQKKYIGSLSAYCGAVSAACGSGAAITYLHGGGYEQISKTIINTIANVGGIVCDGAKPSCAAKIASAVDAAIMAHYMSINDHSFQSGEGLVQDDVEQTIKNIGRVGRQGMRSTDETVLSIMLQEESDT